MQKKLWTLAAILVPLGLLSWALLDPDEPAFAPVGARDGVELRRYEPFWVAETEVSADFAGVSDAAWPRLVGYVTGKNQTGRKVPMRAPVRQQPIGELPAAGADGDWRVQFVMPWEYLPSMLPPPGEPTVALKPVPAHLAAVRRYRGGWGEARFRREAAALADAVAAAGLVPIGAPVFARYNAVFVPGLLRRNEVLIEVRDPAGG